MTRRGSPEAEPLAYERRAGRFVPDVDPHAGITVAVDPRDYAEVRRTFHTPSVTKFMQREIYVENT